MASYSNTPESDVFCAVIRQCLMDCQTVGNNVLITNYGQSRAVSTDDLKAEQRRLVIFDLNHAWMKEICSLAGIEFDKFYKLAIDLLKRRRQIDSHLFCRNRSKFAKPKSPNGENTTGLIKPKRGPRRYIKSS